jgi:uncharacterized damage-inducible protein DinB
MLEHLNNLAAYNTWANLKIKQFAAEAGEDRNRMEQVSSFSSIQKTIIHILNAQTIWYQRLHGNSPLVWPDKEHPSDTLAICDQLIENSRAFEKYTGGLKPGDELGQINYLTIKGDRFTNTVTEIICHLMNHGTFHRGQLITLFRGAGMISLSSTDLISFYREPKS